ncbi:T-cell surface protein tactile isoform X9 [Cavia porcellus]|uniref:T-cell surface protein tactile isoform X9 n=1 Tax=Cavia porcellus TaxID=10141 RepID=UPI002FE016AB
MEKKWTYYAVCSIIQIQFVRGIWEDISDESENIYALPGSDVDLTCQLQKKSQLVQTQWSKVTDKMDLIAIYHDQHGFYCANMSPCESLVTFLQTPWNVTKWILHLRNISSSLTGKYKCSFTLFPDGIRTRTYNVIQVPVIQDEWRNNYTIEIEINQTLEIPCFQNISSEILSALTFTWLVEDNGTQETIISQNHHISNATSFADRVTLDTSYRLHLFPVQIQDDGRKFSCHVGVKSGKIFKSSTTVKVFAKPEIPKIMENKTTDVLGKSIFTCSLKNVFPKANLTWFIDGRILQSDKEELYITTEERKDKSGFLELKSVLTKMHHTTPVQSNNLTIWCTALFRVPGNKVRNTASEKITFSLGSVNFPTEAAFSVTASTLGTQPSPTNSESLTTVSWIPSETYSLSTLGAGSTLHVTKSKKSKDGMSWPVIVAALLSFCVVLLGFGVRKWCQYQREIMERPPPFKPPPPPIKYTYIQEPMGSDLPCHEMETL